MSDTENPFDSLRNITAFWCGDWSTDKRLAWLYGIVSGWDDDEGDDNGGAMDEMARRHGWTLEAVDRLRRLRREFQRAEALAMLNPPDTYPAPTLGCEMTDTEEQLREALREACDRAEDATKALCAMRLEHAITGEDEDAIKCKARATSFRIAQLRALTSPANPTVPSPPNKFSRPWAMEWARYIEEYAGGDVLGDIVKTMLSEVGVTEEGIRPEENTR